MALGWWTPEVLTKQHKLDYEAIKQARKHGIDPERVLVAIKQLGYTTALSREEAQAEILGRLARGEPIEGDDE